MGPRCGKKQPNLRHDTVTLAAQPYLLCAQPLSNRSRFCYCRRTMCEQTSEALFTILICEDDDAIRKLLWLVLSREGYRIKMTANGREGLETALGQRIDLILLDLNMPILDGAGFCKAYREQGGSAPILLLSAAEGASIERAVASHGAVGGLTKPFRIDELLAIITRCVHESVASDLPEITPSPSRV